MNELDTKIPMIMTSAMFGPKGTEWLRTGDKWWERRRLGLGWLLYAFTRVMEPEIVVEAGAGGSSFCILEALKDNGKGHLYTIDCWPTAPPCTGHGVTQRSFPDGTPFTFEHCWFLDKIKECGYEDICTLYYDKAQNVGLTWDKPIDIFVDDSSHLEEETKLEMERFLPHIVPGGYAFFHDPLACLYEIGYQLEEYVKKYDDFTMMIEPDYLSMAIIQRKFSFDCAPMWVSGTLAAFNNPKRENTPFQGTDYRSVGVVKPWKGRWIPEREECMVSHDKMRDIGKKIIDSGEEQTLEFVERMIKENE